MGTDKRDMSNWKQGWLQEERRSFQGWDFSALSGRMEEEKLPWDYEAAVRDYIRGTTGNLLDMGTGGGEFLLSLSPPGGRTYATEAYPPNVELCRKLLPPRGIELRQVFSDEELPFADESFELVMNRHEAFSVREVHRILKPGGVFITQQVGGKNNRALPAFLLGDGAAPEADDFCLEPVCSELRSCGFTVIEASENFPLLRFRDVGALVYFAKIIDWEFPGFSVESCYDRLVLLQQQLERNGYVESMEHRFMITAVKR